MALLQTIFFTFIALGLLVTFHEFGHFWVARRCGVHVERFSIGFGKALLRWSDKQNTEFVLALLPLGGYVKMLDQRETEVSEQDLAKTFNHKSVAQRMAIISAGPIANFVLAIGLFWLIFLSGERGLAPLIGKVEDYSLADRAGLESGMEIVAVNGVSTQTLSSVSRQLFNFIGTTGDIPLTVIYPDSELRYQVNVPVVAWLKESDNPQPLRALGIAPPFQFEGIKLIEIMEQGAAQAAGFQKDDQLIAVNGRSITSVEDFIESIAENPGNPLDIQLQRSSEDQTIILSVTPESDERDGVRVGKLGVQLAPVGQYLPSQIRTVNYNLFSALIRGVKETYDSTVFVVSSIGKLIVGEISPKNLSGPITIAKVAGDTARAGLDNFIRFIAILSIMLGVMNLLPIPVLDGGHLLFCIIELVKGSPVSDQLQILGYKVGFALLISLMVFATFNDLTRAY